LIRLADDDGSLEILCPQCKHVVFDFTPRVPKRVFAARMPRRIYDTARRRRLVARLFG